MTTSQRFATCETLPAAARSSQSGRQLSTRWRSTFADCASVSSARRRATRSPRPGLCGGGSFPFQDGMAMPPVHMATASDEPIAEARAHAVCRLYPVLRNRLRPEMRTSPHLSDAAPASASRVPCPFLSGSPGDPPLLSGKPTASRRSLDAPRGTRGFIVALLSAKSVVLRSVGLDAGWAAGVMFRRPRWEGSMSCLLGRSARFARSASEPAFLNAPHHERRNFRRILAYRHVLESSFFYSADQWTYRSRLRPLGR